MPAVTPFAGFVGLLEQTYPVAFMPCIEVGWRLDTRYWGRGYATEAGRAALSYGFGVSAWSLPGNSSIRSCPPATCCDRTCSTERRRAASAGGSSSEGPAATYSPWPFQAKYHRRCGA